MGNAKNRDGKSSRPRGGAALGLMLAGLTAAGACSESPVGAVPDPLLQVMDVGGVVFITQNEVPNAFMEALFEGTVSEDASGCLRLDSADGPTVVWPKGFTLDTSGATDVVVDASGSALEEVGGAFRLSGGEVDELRDAMGFTSADRLNAAVCPGKYWLVGEEAAKG